MEVDWAQERKRSCLSCWFPVLSEANIPVPRTEVLVLDPSEAWEMCRVLEGDGSELYRRVCAWVREAADSVGYPAFLRTGQTSGKHDWDRTCYLAGPNDVQQHIASLIEFSEVADMLGLPYNVWAVREMLPTTPLFRCAGYRGFPVVEEYRCFVRDGRVECSHPYWPMDALEDGEPDNPNWRALAESISRETPAECIALAERVAALFDGYWSVDVLKTDRGWYVTDMAVGEVSYHADGCPNMEVRDG